MTHGNSWLRLAALWAAAYGATALLLAWSGSGARLLLALAALLVAGVFIGYRQLRAKLTQHALIRAAIFFLGIALVGALPFAWQLYRLGPDWEELQQQRDHAARAELDTRINLLRVRGDQAINAAAQVPLEQPRRLFARIAELQARTKVDALIVFGDSGELVAWAGQHRGRIPADVRLGTRHIYFSEGPLYTYLYFVRAHEQRGRVLAAVLVDAALPPSTDQSAANPQINPFVGRNAAFIKGPGAPGEWSFVDRADTLFHARIEPTSQAEWRQDSLRAAQRLQIALLLAALVLLALAWFREPARAVRMSAWIPYLGTVVGVALAPWGTALGLEKLFSPELFLLPGPGTTVLGTVAAALLATGVFVAATRPRARYRNTVAFVAAAMLLAGLLPFLIQVLIGPVELSALVRWRAATGMLLQGGPHLWVAFQFSMVLLLAIALTLVNMLPRAPAGVPARRRQRDALVLIATAMVASAALAITIVALARTRERVTTWFVPLWIVPVILAGFGAASYQREGRRLVRWLLAGWLAATLVLPYTWVAQVDTLLRSAEREIATLGMRPDAYLDFLLRQFGREAIARRERGEDGLQLLYRSWVSSGLAQEAYPARITIWDARGQPTVRLPLGDAFTPMEEQREMVPAYLRAAIAQTQQLAYPQVFLAPETEQISQVLVVPFDGGRTVTVEVPPRRTFERTSVVAPFLGSRSNLSTSLELVTERRPTGGRLWRPTDEGWRSETVVHFPDTNYHAHLTVRLPGFFVQVARGALVIAADLSLLLLLWLLGRVVRGEPVAPRNGWFGWLGTFRSRVTATLFLFFLLPTVAFGWVAYGALAREVQRAARIVAERAVRQAVLEFPTQGDLGELAAHAGAEVLLYFQGELASASSQEAIELGVFSVLMPADIFLAIDGGDLESGVAAEPIGDQEFLTAYRRLQPAGTGIMGIPISLESQETVQRQREMAHLVLFAALFGGIGSLLLSLAVGRALTGPIGRLQRAATAIGAGRLNVQLPEDTGDEFGRLYATFNRMVRRLRRARAQELRTARVIAWGEMARQVAHEIKNPLTPIKLAVQHLRRSHADRRPDFERVLNDSVDQILIEIDRLTDIARAFSRYGAPAESAGPLETVTIGTVVQEALTLYRTGDTRVRYLDEIAPDLPPVFSRAGELKEVLLNLLENARDASREGGTVVVSARREGLAVELCVRDDGVGIPRDQLARIFDPHFSTRTTGTGLGLPIVRRLVESWGGIVDADSEAGRGTTIRIRLQAVTVGGAEDAEV